MKIPIPIPGILEFLGFFTQDLSGIFTSFSSLDPDYREPRNFGICGIFRSSPKLKIPKKPHPEANSDINYHAGRDRYS